MVTRTTTSFSSNGRSIPADFFHLSTGHNGALIIIAYGSDGLIDNQNGPWKTMIEGYAIDLATKGFVTAIPDYFAASGTSPGDLNPQNPTMYIEQIAANRGAWLTALKDSFIELAKPSLISGIDSSRIGLLGFSLGGHLCARLAGQARASVLFFAPYMDGLGTLGSLSGHVEIHHGADDFLAYSSNAEVIEKKLSERGANVVLWPAYPGAVHGFVGSDLDDGNARLLSHTRTLNFFEARL